MKFLVLCLVFVLIFSIDANAFDGVLGGPKEITDTDKRTHLLDQIKKHLETLSSKPNHPQLEYVGHSSATYQIVAGTLYKMNGTLKENDQEVICALTLWEKPWMNFEKFTAHCGEEPVRTYESTVGEERRRKRAILLGGPQNVPEEEWPEIHTKLLNAFDQFHAKHENFDYNYKNIVEATKQTVAGIKYAVKVIVNVGKSKDQTKECNISVWEKSWEQFYKFTFECDDDTYEYTSSPATSASTNE